MNAPSAKRRSPLAAPKAALLAAAAFALAGMAACAPQPAPTAPAPAPSQAPATTAADAVTCGGQGVDPAAKIRYRTETTINAPLDEVWRLHTDVESWPSWQPAVLANKLLDPGPPHPGSRFRWTTPVPATPTTPATTLEITSTVQQIEPNRCIRWTGPAVGPGLRIDNGVHVWKFAEVNGAVRVVTEETHTGRQIETDVPLATKFLGAGLEEWLRNLKATAEARAHQR